MELGLWILRLGRGAERRSLRTAGGGRFGMIPPPRMRSLRAEVSASVGHFQAAWQVELPVALLATRGATDALQR